MDGHYSDRFQVLRFDEFVIAPKYIGNNTQINAEFKNKRATLFTFNNWELQKSQQTCQMDLIIQGQNYLQDLSFYKKRRAQKLSFRIGPSSDQKCSFMESDQFLQVYSDSFTPTDKKFFNMRCDNFVFWSIMLQLIMTYIIQYDFYSELNRFWSSFAQRLGVRTIE